MLMITAAHMLSKRLMLVNNLFPWLLLFCLIEAANAWPVFKHLFLARFRVHEQSFDNDTAGRNCPLRVQHKKAVFLIGYRFSDRSQAERCYLL